LKTLSALITACLMVLAGCLSQDSEAYRLMTGQEPYSKAHPGYTPTQLGAGHKHNFQKAGSYYRSTAPSISAATDAYNCSDFSNTAEAQAFFIRSGGPSLDPHRLDADGDGFACEFDPSKLEVPTTTNYNYRPSSNCHWVSGYTRRDGTRVRGHRRCR